MSSPTILVIFGATGDLVHKKIIPSLYSLFKNDELPVIFKVIAFARRDFNDGKYNEIIKESLRDYAKVNLETEDISEFCEMFVYHQGNFDDLESYNSMVAKIHDLEKNWDDCSNKLFYLAVPPESYGNLLNHVNSSGATRTCVKEGSFARIIIEKPFGHNFKTALDLNNVVTKLFTEDQIYRIDHYLGKPLIREIVLFRKKFLTDRWNSENIQSMEISTLEPFGVEKRGSFYDPIGTLRDMGQNHLLGILSLLTLNLSEAEDLEFARYNILKDLHKMNENEIKKNTFRAQYEGYREIKDVNPESKTETYFRLKAKIDNKTWENTEFILEAGKQFSKMKKTIDIKFRNGDSINFDFDTKQIIRMNIGEEENIVDLPDTRSLQYVGEYATMLQEAIDGDQSYFVGIDEVLEEWKFVDPIVEAWKKDIVPLEKYSIGAENIETGI